MQLLSLKQFTLHMTRSQLAVIPFTIILARHLFWSRTRAGSIWMTQRSFDILTDVSCSHHQGGWGCPACADNVNMHSSSYSRNPKHCRLHDTENYYKDCPNF
eukprot:62583-Pyramimonas_sp.AAC.1